LQLVWVLTVSSDGAVPLAHRVEAGNTADDVTHIPTWDALVNLVGRADFLYVADCKLCNRAAMDHIDARHGRFLSVMPRSRAEDGEFRRWIADHEPDWAELRRCPGRRKADPDQCWWGFEWPRPSAEGYRICWIRSSTKLAKDSQVRAERIRRASKELESLAARLASPRSRHRDKVAVEAEAVAILEATSTTGLIGISVTSVQEERMRQEGTGRPGPDTRYRKLTRVRLGLSFCVDADAVKAVAASDGCFPLITNDKTMTPAALLDAYKYQPNLERRHADLKGPMEVAPVFLKDPARIEGLLCLEFVAQLTRALIEREIRSAMAKADITHLPLYPEDRACSAPSATRIFQLFSGLTRNHLLHNGRVVQVFPPQLSPLQLQVLDLLGIPASAYTD
jgi:transposase